jgi:hypothetical protein
MRGFILVLAAAPLWGCQSAPDNAARYVPPKSILAPAPGAVAFTTDNRMAGACTRLGHAETRDTGARGRSLAIQRMVDRVKDVGGNLVVTQGPELTKPGDLAVMRGDIYLC